MQRTSQFIGQWTGSPLVALLLAAATIASASAQQQPSPDFLPNAPGYELSDNDGGKSPGLPDDDADPSLHTFGRPHLRIDDLRIDNPRIDDLTATPGKATGSDTNPNFTGLPDSPGRISADSNSGSVIVAIQRPVPETKVQWKIALQESLLYTGVMHTFNLWTEAGTRDALYGPLAQQLPPLCGRAPRLERQRSIHGPIWRPHHCRLGLRILRATIRSPLPQRAVRRWPHLLHEPSAFDGLFGNLAHPVEDRPHQRGIHRKT